ncbi:MAG: NYN domain-containing protein, partial [bacterium]|nr:NYN domain-containing protein [bacterium]
MHLPEPTMKRVYAFFDLQNLYLSVKHAWNISFPNFDPIALSMLVVGAHQDWALTGIRLYTGIHTIKKNEFWHNFWINKLTFHKNADRRVDTFNAPLHYNNGVP